MTAPDSAASASAEDTPADDLPTRGAAVALAIVFAVLFGLATFGPVSNLVALPQVYAAYGIADATPWVLLVAGVLVPPVLYVAGLLLGRGRPLFSRTLVLIGALAAAFALGLSLIAWVAALQPALG